MSNLLNDNEGRNVVLVAQKDLLERRISRFFERNLVVDYDQWSNGGEFDLATLLGDLNVAWDDELRDLYRLLGHVGGLNESVQDETIYVNSTTGSDTEGTGSAAEPYASLWFLSNLPNVIGHDYRVLITGDIDMEDTIDIDVSFVGEGCLSIIGVGAAVDPYAGIFNGAVTNEWAWNNSLHSIELSNPPVGTTVTRYFYRATSGGDLNRVAPVTRFLTPIVHVRLDPTVNVAAADNYSFCIPAYTINCYGLSLNANNGGNVPRQGVAPNTSMASRINFVNLNIRIDEDRDSCYRNIVTRGAPMGFWFCRLLIPDGNETEKVVFQNDVNKYNPTVEASLLEDASQSGITNMFQGFGIDNSCGCFIVCRDSDEFAWNAGTDRFNPILRLEENSRVKSVDCMAQWKIEEANVQIIRCSASQFRIRNSLAHSWCVWTCTDDNDTDRIGVYAEVSMVNWVDCVMGLMETCFSLLASQLRMSNVEGAIGPVSDYDYIIRLSGISKALITEAWTGDASNVSDIYFPDPAAPISVAFPGAGAIQTDALENTVLRPA